MFRPSALAARHGTMHRLAQRAVTRNGLGGRAAAATTMKTTRHLSALVSSSSHSLVTSRCDIRSRYALVVNINRRTMMAEGGGDKQGKAAPIDDGSGDSTELATLTPGEKVVVGTRLAMWAGIAVFASACAYFIGRELLPSKMSPNNVFDKAFVIIKGNSEIARRFGEPLKAYGRDHGGHREGRRNFIEHTEYTDKDDGSKRLRVRFNIEGQHGQAFVFAEASSAMDSGEFVYVIVQDKRNGRTINVVDNRSAMAAQRMAGGSKEGQEALGNLMGGFRK
jgi:import inner membrane translocase subunit TIM21